jgi:rhodanese-related sulfurtransferase
VFHSVYHELTTTEINNMNYIEIDASQLSSLQQGGKTLIIDVRERHEAPILDSNIYTKVPMSEFSVFLQTDIQAESIVFLCQHGIRSVVAAEALQEKYGNAKKIYSLKGGIVKWRKHFVNT